MKIRIDRGRCIGASLCLVAAPRVFMLDGTRKALVMDPSGADPETIRQAAAACPTGAIQIEGDDQGETASGRPPGNHGA